MPHNALDKRSVFYVGTFNYKTNRMKEYLENRINELKEADARACEKRWDMSKPEYERKMWREASNEITARRHELEDALKFLNSKERK